MQCADRHDTSTLSHGLWGSPKHACSTARCMVSNSGVNCTVGSRVCASTASATRNTGYAVRWCHVTWWRGMPGVCRKCPCSTDRSYGRSARAVCMHFNGSNGMSYGVVWASWTTTGTAQAAASCLCSTRDYVCVTSHCGGLSHPSRERVRGLLGLAPADRLELRWRGVMSAGCISKLLECGDVSSDFWDENDSLRRSPGPHGIMKA